MQDVFLLKSGRFKKTGTPAVEVSADTLQRLSSAPDFVRSPAGELADCPCGRDDDVIVTQTDRHGLAYRLVLCNTCGLLRMNPQPEDGHLAWYYSNLYRPLYDQSSPAAEVFLRKLWKSELLEKVLNRSTFNRPFSSVLDIGCGGGWTMKIMHDMGAECVGYDFSQDLIEYGIQQGFDLRLGGSDEAIKDGARGDLVIYSHILEHVRDPVAELEKLRELIGENGMLYIETPYIGRIKKRLHGDALKYWQRAHLWEFQLEHVIYFLRKAGFSILWSDVDDDSCYVLCEVDAGANSQDLEFPLLGSRVRAQIVGFERQRTSLLTALKQRIMR